MRCPYQNPLATAATPFRLNFDRKRSRQLVTLHFQSRFVCFGGQQGVTKVKNLLISATVATLCCSALAAQTSIEQSKTIPIMLHPDTDHGTCGIGLRVNPGGAELRSGPGTQFPVIAILEAGHVVSGCNERDGWDGVIDGQDETCSIGISVATPRPYIGPCDSGWIDQNSLTSIYG